MLDVDPFIEGLGYGPELMGYEEGIAIFPSDVEGPMVPPKFVHDILCIPKYPPDGDKFGELLSLFPGAHIFKSPETLPTAFGGQFMAFVLTPP